VREDIIQLEEVLRGKGLFWLQVQSNYLPTRHHVATPYKESIFVTGGLYPRFGPWRLTPKEVGYTSAKGFGQTPIGNGKWEWVYLSSEGASVPPPLKQHTATIITWQRARFLLVLGGCDAFISQFSLIPRQPLKGWLFNLVTNEWRPLPKFKGSFPLDRYGHSTTAVDLSTVVVMGGVNCLGQEENNIYILNFNNLTCAAVTPKATFKISRRTEFPGELLYPLSHHAFSSTSTIRPSKEKRQRRRKKRKRKPERKRK